MKLPHEKERLARIGKFRSKFEQIAKLHGTPCYVFDREEVVKNLNRFRDSFIKNDCPIEVHYAVKSNPSELLLKTLVTNGAGLDVSSIRELRLAIRAGAKKIVYTGPGKTAADFKEIVKFKGELKVHLESLVELERLSKVARSAKKEINCALRVHTSAQAGWTKFGIPLKQLKNAWDVARKSTKVRICGVHFHISFVSSPKTYLTALKELCLYAKAEFSPSERKEVEFIDIGGGFCPESFEGLYTWNTSQQVNYELFPAQARKAVRVGAKPFWRPYSVIPIEKFGASIAKFYRQQLLEVFPNVRLFAEPGRFISHSCEHFLMRVLDKKDNTTVIVDGGNNMVGWEEHYQFLNYAPIVNLTRYKPEREFGCLVYGPLCTPGDMWGYYLRGSGIEQDDLLVMPYQGAYTLTLAQNFIRGVPKEVAL